MGERPMNLLVTGGAGYIGSHMVKRLVAMGHGVTVLDNLSTGRERLLRAGAEFFRSDLLDFPAVAAAIGKRRPDAVLHFAAFSQVGESIVAPRKYLDNNIVGALNLLGALLDAGVDKFVFSSSASIFGIPAGVPITEEFPCAPINPYGLSKTMIEAFLAEYDRAYGLRSVCLRYFNAAGADPERELGEMHDPETHLIPLALRASAEGARPLMVFGNDYPTPDGTCLRDYIHVEDLVDAHLLALDHLSAGGESRSYNLGNGEGYSVLEVIAKCREVTGRAIAYELAGRRQGDPPSLVASSEKIRKDLGWSPRRGLDDIVRSAWAWERVLGGGRETDE